MMSHSILLHCNENVEVSVTRKKQAIWRAHPGWTEQQFRVAWLKRKREIFYNLCNDDLDTTQQREGPGDPLPQAQATDQAGLVGGFLLDCHWIWLTHVGTRHLRRGSDGPAGWTGPLGYSNVSVQQQRTDILQQHVDTAAVRTAAVLKR